MIIFQIPLLRGGAKGCAVGGVCFEVLSAPDGPVPSQQRLSKTTLRCPKTLFFHPLYRLR
jgi:hypothetical protein